MGGFQERRESNNKEVPIDFLEINNYNYTRYL